MATVEKLFFKELQEKGAYKESRSLYLSPKGIQGGIKLLPFRQVLINSVEVLNRFSLLPGQLKENILIRGFDIHTLKSGTVIKVGEAKIQLTYHCEPCKKIKSIINPNKIKHQRGYLGKILEPGLVQFNDTIEIQSAVMEEIPYDIKDRIRWYLDQQTETVSLKKLAYEVSLSNSYIRAIPNMLKKMDKKYAEKVDYPSKKVNLTLFD